jgi:dihydroorotate dehydrogenase
MYRLVRPLLFLLPAELAHHLGLIAMRWLGALGFVRRRLRRRLTPDLPELACERFGLQFATPLGVGAGLDKAGDAASGLFALGFGFVEVGTVTPRAQPGNPRPRLFRVAADGALVNRMGFNNPGAEAVVARLRGAFRPGPLGLNLGKNKLTPEEGAAADYATAARAVRDIADYVVINVSSPNTPGLRDLQRVERLVPLLEAVRAELPGKPLLLKLSPDLDDPGLDALCDAVKAAGLAGVIATNTTLTRPSAVGSYAEQGGLSGRPLAPLARRALQRVHRRLGVSVALVGVGGLESPADLLERLRDGASLLQAYTGFIYGGPGWPSRATLGLARELRAAGFRSVDEAVGAVSRSDAPR